VHQRDQPHDSEEIELTPLQALAAILKDVRIYFFLALHASNCLAWPISDFIPTMLRGIRYSQISTQWMTVPI
jgi:hypothetical protein